jgi:hypothetical protein
VRERENMKVVKIRKGKKIPVPLSSPLTSKGVYVYCSLGIFIGLGVWAMWGLVWAKGQKSNGEDIS